MGLESQENQYLNGRTVLNCSDMTAAEIDKEVMHILKVSYEEAKRLLSENREALDKIAAFLIEKETITGKELAKIFHEVKEFRSWRKRNRKARTGLRCRRLRRQAMRCSR